ncbi:MAG: OstA family protein [Fischerella sp.]|jgi:lipopolysaccharide export system protein LptA|uniref:LptA/OstA family protein n=1 Tax=Fischerella sp. TaxID=1191 RepID=UPI001810CC20|nr:LptA/OstA family protein [Fischerella sp.]NWF61491.1 OstA family protein [Fischerella sp.]
MMPWYQLPLFSIRRAALTLMLPAAFLGAIAFPNQLQIATAQTSGQTSGENRPIQIKSDIQEYDAKTQVATARGNVQMVYAARGIQATAAQAQYFSKERRIVLSGNVYVLQQGGNSIRGETVTYLIDNGRFVVQPKAGRQVESIYIVNDSQVNQATSPAPATAPFQRSN